jgi:neutral ceramidase
VINVARLPSILRWALGSLVFLGVLTFSFIGPIDRTPLDEQVYYQTMMKQLDTLQFSGGHKGKLKSDWTKVNITPAGSMPMAGYKPRSGFDHVHDSLYARIISIDNGETNALLINVDLLLFPPLLKQRLEEKLKVRNLNYFLYLSATHTHNGIGGWDDSAIGHFVLGDYHEEWIERTASDMVDGIANLKPVATSISNWEFDASEWIENRIAFENGEKDGKLRGFTLKREDHKRAVFFTYSAHATSIRKESKELSADYPAEVIRLAEQQVDFGMYMAGMVGSHRFVWSSENDFEYVAKMGSLVYGRIDSISEGDRLDSVSVRTAHIPIEFGSSQMRIGKDWKIRDWLFRFLLNPLQGELTFLELGNLVLIGTPCDFSGEIYVREKLEAAASAKGKQLIITSFNGNYNGYITYDGHYETLSKDEVRIMNWVGPYHGKYFSDMIKKILSQ